MIMSCKQSYFLIRLEVHFPYFASRTRRGLLLTVLLQVTFASFSCPLISIDHDSVFLLYHGQYYDSIRVTQTSLAIRDTKTYELSQNLSCHAGLTSINTMPNFSLCGINHIQITVTKNLVMMTKTFTYTLFSN